MNIFISTNTLRDMNEHYNDIPELSDLYLFQESDIEAAAEVNADAYMNYTLMKELLDGKFCRDLIKKVWAISMRSLKKSALFIADSKQINGVSIWAKPGFRGSEVIPYILAGGYKVHPKILYRLAKYEQYCMELKKKYTNHESWYLYDIVVKPHSQKRGVGKSLLSPMLNYLDRIKQSCYLETHNEENVEVYKKFGFRVVEEGRVPESFTPHYAMLRVPQ